MARDFEQEQGRRVVFRGKGAVECETFKPEPPGDGEVAVRSLYSLMSMGTENIVLNQNYAPGTHWDNWVKFPFYPGYSTIGAVEDPASAGGSRLVALRTSHASSHVVGKEDCIAVPEGIDPRHAVWFALAKIAFLGVRAGGCTLGSRVLVIGAGPIGQMTLRWVAAAGAAELLVVDPAGGRLELARRGGATRTLAEPIEELPAQLDKSGSRPDIVIDTTGNAKVFTSALASAADFGRMVVLGDTGFPGQQALSPDVIRRGLTIVGAHDGHNTPAWNNHTISALFFDLVVRKRIDLEGLNSHEFQPEQAAEAYHLANTRRTETMGVVFNWGL